MEKFQSDVEIAVDESSAVQNEKIELADAFNVFDILGLPLKDTHTHSAFIAELLDPQGRHCQKDKFLKLFLSVLNITETLDTENAKVTKDKSIGEVDWDEMTGGQIDIVIEFQNPKFAIIIKNEIEAREQSAQLTHYKNLAEQEYPSAHKIFYLTLDGHEPVEHSTSHDVQSDEKYWQCISYNNEIKTWLFKCEFQSGEYLIVESTIRQYRTLVSHITNEDEMESAFKNLSIMANKLIKTLCKAAEELEKENLISNPTEED